MVVLGFSGVVCRSVAVADLGSQGFFDATGHLLDYSFHAPRPFRRDDDLHRDVCFVVWSSSHFLWLGSPVFHRDDQRWQKTEDTKCRLTNQMQ